ncbi:MAG: hypothetical protein IPJ68_06265 [Candidatus Moraniibacteriota bacterium]|nr:MAG: hypothetical protein IPJ68_06265 [Candidatus Moranbacteria bacterium]
MTDFLLLFLSFLTVTSLLLSLVFVVGIVWRVELELDLSFKFFSFAVIFLLAAEVLDLLPVTRLAPWWSVALPVVKLCIAANLLLGLFFMRDLIRRMDGEKESSARVVPERR